MSKITIYQVLVRLFGNAKKKQKINGTLEENGVGKMNNFTPEILNDIKQLGVTHIWYTGLLEHATQTDYTNFDIKQGNPDVIKGIAGSPYAVKDYYDIDPDLAVEVKNRRKEFQQLVKRTHKAGLKVILDFIPNHVAREYHSDVSQKGIPDFGANDNSNIFSPQNNFYYVSQEPLCTDFFAQNSTFHEQPAKATGNDRFDKYPNKNDWYETVKLNYGIDYFNHTYHFDPIPDTWQKMLHILLYWAKQGVDGFRCDMAEMVPCDFWHWVIQKVKEQYPQIIFIAEVYNPSLYRDYIYRGGFDYLYDKVGFYDTLRAVVEEKESATALTKAWQAIDDIQKHMLNFLENHDEQRLASAFFANNAQKGKPALVASACLNTSPFMVYFGQELGEEGMEQEGFSGLDGRTTIFDYWCIDKLQRYLTIPCKSKKDELNLRAFYQKILNLCLNEEAIRNGQTFDLMYANCNDLASFNYHRMFTFLRKGEQHLFLFVCNFSDDNTKVNIHIPQHAFEHLSLNKGKYKAVNYLTQKTQQIDLDPTKTITLSVPKQNALILKINLEN